MSDLSASFLKATRTVLLAKEAAANELAWMIVRELRGGKDMLIERSGALERKVKRLADAIKELLDEDHSR